MKKDTEKKSLKNLNEWIDTDRYYNKDGEGF